MPLPSPPFHEPEAIKHPVADGKEPSIGEILPVILGPNITGRVDSIMSPNSSWSASSNISGAFTLRKIAKLSSDVVGGSGDTELYLGFDAKNSNQIYHTNSTVQPLALVLNYIIKY